MEEISIVDKCLRGVSEYHRVNDNKIVPLSSARNSVIETLVIKMNHDTYIHMLSQPTTLLAISSGAMILPDCGTQKEANNSVKQCSFGTILDAKIVLYDNMSDNEIEITTEIGG